MRSVRVLTSQFLNNKIICRHFSSYFKKKSFKKLTKTRATFYRFLNLCVFMFIPLTCMSFTFKAVRWEKMPPLPAKISGCATTDQRQR